MSEAVAEPTEADEEAQSKTAPKSWFTSESARRAAAESARVRAQRRSTKALPASDEAIERGLRDRALTSAKDAETLIRWLARPRSEASGMGLDEMPEQELETLYAGLLRLAGLEPSSLAALIETQQ